MKKRNINKKKFLTTISVFTGVTVIAPQIVQAKEIIGPVTDRVKNIILSARGLSDSLAIDTISNIIGYGATLNDIHKDFGSGRVKSELELQDSYNSRYFNQANLLAASDDDELTLEEDFGNFPDLYNKYKEMLEKHEEHDNITLGSKLSGSDTKFRDMVTVDIKDYKFYKLPDFFTVFRNISNLNLDGNNLTKLSSDILDKTSVRSLSIKDNQLSDITGISKLFNLKILTLDNNKIKELPKEISKLDNLQVLNLKGNCIQYIPDEVWSMHNLKEIHIENNDLRALNFEKIQSSGIKVYIDGNPISYKIVDISGKGLDRIPDSFFNCRYARRFVATGNNIKQIQDSIGNLKYCDDILLDFNLLKTIPKTISQCKDLRKLSLASNEIVSVPDEIKQCKKLDILDLSNNNFLKKVSDGVLQAPNINTLKVNDTALVELPKVEDTNLRTLVANRTCLQGKDALAGLANYKYLENIDLSENDLNDDLSCIHDLGNIITFKATNAGIDGDALCNILNKRKATYINFSNNLNLKSEIPVTVCSMTNLKELYGDNTSTYGELPSGIFNIPKLEVFQMNNCRLNGRLPEIVRKIKKIEMSNNNFETELRKCYVDGTVEYLDLSHNSITGDIEVLLLQNTSINSCIMLNDNKLSGGNVWFSRSDSYKGINLNNNFIVGKYPRGSDSVDFDKFFDYHTKQETNSACGLSMENNYAYDCYKGTSYYHAKSIVREENVFVRKGEIYRLDKYKILRELADFYDIEILENSSEETVKATPEGIEGLKDGKCTVKIIPTKAGKKPKAYEDGYTTVTLNVLVGDEDYRAKANTMNGKLVKAKLIIDKLKDRLKYDVIDKGSSKRDIQKLNSIINGTISEIEEYKKKVPDHDTETTEYLDKMLKELQGLKDVPSELEKQLDTKKDISGIEDILDTDTNSLDDIMNNMKDIIKNMIPDEVDKAKIGAQLDSVSDDIFDIKSHVNNVDTSALSSDNKKKCEDLLSKTNKVQDKVSELKESLAKKKDKPADEPDVSKPEQGEKDSHKPGDTHDNLFDDIEKNAKLDKLKDDLKQVGGAINSKNRDIIDKQVEIDKATKSGDKDNLYKLKEELNKMAEVLTQLNNKKNQISGDIKKLDPSVDTDKIAGVLSPKDLAKESNIKKLKDNYSDLINKINSLIDKNNSKVKDINNAIDSNSSVEDIDKLRKQLSDIINELNRLIQEKDNLFKELIKQSPGLDIDSLGKITKKPNTPKPNTNHQDVPPVVIPSTDNKNDSTVEDNSQKDSSINDSYNNPSDTSQDNHNSTPSPGKVEDDKPSTDPPVHGTDIVKPSPIVGPIIDVNKLQSAVGLLDRFILEFNGRIKLLEDKLDTAKTIGDIREVDDLLSKINHAKSDLENKTMQRDNLKRIIDDVNNGKSTSDILTELNKSIADNKSKVKELKDKLTDSNNPSSEMIKDLQNKLEDKNSELSKLKQSIQDDLDERNNKIKELKRKIDELKDSSQEPSQEQEREVKRLKQNIDELESKIRKLNSELSDKDSEKKKLEQQLQDNDSASIKQKDAIISDLKVNQRELENKIESLNRLIDTLKNNKNNSDVIKDKTQDSISTSDSKNETDIPKDNSKMNDYYNSNLTALVDLINRKTNDLDLLIRSVLQNKSVGVDNISDNDSKSISELRREIRDLKLELLEIKFNKDNINVDKGLDSSYYAHNYSQPLDSVTRYVSQPQGLPPVVVRPIQSAPIVHDIIRENSDMPQSIIGDGSLQDNKTTVKDKSELIDNSIKPKHYSDEEIDAILGKVPNSGSIDNIESAGATSSSESNKSSGSGRGVNHISFSLDNFWRNLLIFIAGGAFAALLIYIERKKEKKEESKNKNEDRDKEENDLGDK